MILFSDASDLAGGFAAYLRWPCNGIFRSRLALAKSRIAPLVKRSTPQLELNAAVMSKRGREVVEQEVEYSYEKVLHIIDSETVLAMLHKTSTRFRLYEGIRVSEIQAATEGNVSCWAWVAGGDNPADWLTRGRLPLELDEKSEWFSGPAFLAKPEEEWNLKYLPANDSPLPGEKHSVTSHAVNVLTRIPYQNFNSYGKLLRTLARVINMGRRKKLFAVREKLTPNLLEEAELFIIRDVQEVLETECRKEDRKGRVGGKFYRLRPVLDNSVWKVGSRMKFNPMVPENNPQSLLPTKHPVTFLIMQQAHVDTIHGGRDTTLARFRQRFWVPQGSKIAAAVVRKCQLCKLRAPKLLEQKMGQLPAERSSPSPPFTQVICDYFGPYQVRGEVQKRTSGKAWGVIFADLASRAVFIEAVYSYTTDSFLIALAKFAACRGYPKVVYSDPGSNLVGASNELKQQWKKMWDQDGSYISSKLAEKGLEWRFSSADSPWQNGAVEALIKSCKKAISFSMNDQRLTPFEFSAVLYEAANLLNERPLGTLSGGDSELSVITPNSLLLGRSQAKNPGGWQPSSSTLRRFQLVQDITDSFWTAWRETVAPSLITQSKWHTERRNLQVGDVVLVLKDSVLRGEYRLARVKQVYPDSSGTVRKVTIAYKNYKVGEKLVEYSGAKDQECSRPAQRLALIVPVDSEEQDDMCTS